MKTYRLLLLIIISFFIEFNNYAIAQETIAKYKQINNPFRDYKKPVTIAILKFKDSDSLGEVLAMDMLKDPNLLTKFSIYPMSVLKENKNVWGLNNFNAEDINTQQALLRNGKISFIVYGTVTDNTGFTMKVINTNDGIIEYECHYENSSNSTAIADAIKFFSDNKQTLYKDVFNKGTLVVKTVPDKKFQVYLNDKYAGSTPFVKDNLKSGYYKVTIKDSSEAYQMYEANFNFSPKSAAPVEKYITLKPNLGSLQLVLSPIDANIELYNDKNNLIKMGKGIKFIDSLLVGDYKLKVYKTGYLENSSDVVIQKTITAEKEVTLLPETSKYYTINNVVCKSKYARSITFKRSGNKYIVDFDVIGKPDDNFDIELYLMDKANKEFEHKLTKLTGTFGEGKFSGTGKFITWDFEKEFKGGLDNNNLYLKLDIKKVGGGIPWYVWVGGIAAGGVAAAVLIGGKRSGSNNGSSTATSIPTPPGRPGN